MQRRSGWKAAGLAAVMTLLPLVSAWHTATEGGARSHAGMAIGSAAVLDGQRSVGSDPSIQLTEVASSAGSITAIAARPGDDDALYVAEQAGTVIRVEVPSDNEKRVAAPRQVVLDISDETTNIGEQGLLGLAFDTDGSHLYVDFTDAADDATHVVEYTMRGTSAVDARPLLRVAQPFKNHNGGQLAWGPDRMLWIGLGDGGLANDPSGNGQNTDTLLGSILRIDPTPTAGKPYTIPADNPTLGSRPEIWLYGVRNPWRFSFDRANGDLWVADVGQNLWEEINRLPAASGTGKGANLGWNRREGTHAFEDGPDPAAEPGPMIDPVFEYPHGTAGCSVTGGFVYRGSAIPGLDGTYLYADFCAAGLSGLRPDRTGVVTRIGLGTDIAQVTTFGQRNDGELFVANQAGKLYRVDPAR